jgi:uncharacterized protein (TIGR02996 family)
MSSHAAFLQAITSAPEDDVSRLVYADWLDDNGDPRRAEFIRLQCRLASMDESDPERPDLLDREWELLAVYRKRWEPGARTPLGKHLQDSDFTRGFLGRVDLPAKALLTHGEKMFRDYPVVELRLRDMKGRLRDIVTRPWMASVAALELFHEVLSLDELRALTTSPHLGGLRRLTLRNVALTPEGLGILTAWPGLRRLTHLDIGNDYLMNDGERLNNRPGEGWLRRLLESPHLGELTSFQTNGMLDDTVDADIALLANTPRLASLTRLTLHGGLSAEGFCILAAAKGLTALRHLSAGWDNERGVEGVPALVASPLLARLDTLDLSVFSNIRPFFGREAAAALAASPHLGRLRKLNLTQCSGGPEEARAIAKARFGSLVELDLFHNRIGPTGMAALAKSPHLAKLRWLSLLGSQIGSKGLAALLKSKALTGLRYLNLMGNGLGPDDAKLLAGSTHLAQLRHLSVGTNYIGAAGAKTLLRAENLAGLWTLCLTDSNMTDATARDAAANTPLHELRRLVVHHFSSRKLTAEGERALAASPRLPNLLQIDRCCHFSVRPSFVSDVVLEQGKGHEL